MREKEIETKLVEFAKNFSNSVSAVYGLQLHPSTPGERAGRKSSILDFQGEFQERLVWTGRGDCAPARSL